MFLSILSACFFVHCDRVSAVDILFVLYILFFLVASCFLFSRIFGLVRNPIKTFLVWAGGWCLSRTLTSGCFLSRRKLELRLTEGTPWQLMKTPCVWNVGYGTLGSFPDPFLIIHQYHQAFPSHHEVCDEFVAAPPSASGAITPLRVSHNGL